MNFIQQHIKKIILLAASILLLSTTVLIDYKGAKIDLIFSDGMTENNLLQAPFIANDIEIQSIHTHLLKWPFAMIENAVGFTFTTHAIVSILLILAMNVWIGYLIYRFSKKNLVTTSIALVMLASIELFAGINANEGTLSMIQNRNIEIPMMITLVYVLFRQTKIFSTKTIVAALLISLVFVTDLLLLYATAIGVALYFAWTILRTRPKTIRAIENLPLFAGMVLAALFSKIIVYGFGALGIANFYERSNNHLQYAQSFKAFFDNILNYIDKIFDVFGAGFFGQQIFLGPFFAISIVALAITVWLTIRFVHDVKTKKELSHEEKTLSFLLSSYFFAMLVFTVLIPRELAGRYFAFLPIIGLLLFAYYFSNLKFVVNQKSVIFSLVTIVLLGGFFLCGAKIANFAFYNEKFDSLTVRLGDSSTLINHLTENDVTVYVDQDYFRNQIIKQQYDEKTNKQLDIPSVYCGGKIVDKQFSRKSWAIADGSKVAIRVKECSADEVTKEFGSPDKTVYLSDEKNDALFIYNRDIRSEFDLKEYAHGFLKP